MNQNCIVRQVQTDMLESLIIYIEDNLQSSLSLDILAQESHLTKYTLIRLFSRLICMTPMDYVRERRLARSLPQLMAGEKILDVALEWGFQYEQSYIRAFRKTYGITPAQLCRNPRPIKILEVPRLREAAETSI